MSNAVSEINNTEAPLQLFTVTLDWNASDSSQGDYQVNSWALNPDQAILNVAEEMADHEDSGLEENDEEGRAEFINSIVENAGPYAVTTVANVVLSNVHDLLAGPTCTLEGEAAKDYEAIKTILMKYGVSF